MLDPSNIQISWSRFKTTFLDIMEQCIPRAVLPNRKNLPWLIKEIIQLIRKRNLYFKKPYRSGRRDDRLMFKKLRYKVVANLRHAKHKFFWNLHPHNQKEFWKVVKSLNSKQSIIPTLKNGDIIATSNLEKANLLNASLVKNFKHSLPRLTLSDLPHTSPDSCPTDFLFTEEEVYSLLSTLDTTKANGHDDILARILKETALSITPAVTELFNISIRLGELPDEWKVSRISPIPKSDNHSDPGSYRPISLLSILSKLLEKHIRDILLAHFEEHHPMSTQQWGFTCGKSTTGALLDATGLESWNRVKTSALYFLTTVKLSIQFHTGLYCKSFKIMVYTNRSSDGLHIIFAHARNMCV